MAHHVFHRGSIGAFDYYSDIVLKTIAGEGLNILAGWKLDEDAGVGTAADVGGSVTLTLGSKGTQGVATGVALRPVAVSSVREAGDVLTAANPTELDFDFSADAFSILAWVKCSTSLSMGLMSKNATAPYQGFQIPWRSDANQVQFTLYSGGTTKSMARVDDACDDGLWHLWVFTYNSAGGATSGKIYRDTESATTGDLTGLGSGASTATYRLGDGQDFLPMAAQFNHVYFLDGEISAAGVATLYNGG